jgi:hypothetical protein
MSGNYGIARVHTLNDIDERIQLIGKQVDVSQRDPRIRAVALKIVEAGPFYGADGEQAECVQVFRFVKDNIQYRQDPRDYDYYATAWRTLQMGSGDCDDHACLCAAILHNLGFRTGAKVISPDGSNWHIYAVAGINTRAEPTQILPLDTTQPESYPGWEPGAMYRKHEILATFVEGHTYLKRVR